MVLAALVAISATSFAQAPASAGPGTTTQPSKRPQPPAEPPADRHAQKPAKELGLNADQRARQQPILRAQRQEIQSIRDEARGAGRRGLAPQVKALQAPSKFGRGFFVELDAAGFSACSIGFAHFQAAHAAFGRCQDQLVEPGALGGQVDGSSGFRHIRHLAQPARCVVHAQFFFAPQRAL